MNDSKKSRRSYIIIGAILIVAFIVWGVMYFVSNQNSDTRRVHIVDGEGTEYYYPLHEAGTHTFTTDYGTNVVEIADNGVKMASSTCPNQDCVHVGVIHSSSEMILCLPNQVFVTIIDDNPDENSPDSTSI